MMKLQKINPVLAVALCTAVSWSGLLLADNTDGDILIDPKIFEDDNTPPIKRTPEPKVMDELAKRLQAYTSIPRVWMYGDYTLSAFSKSCQWVVAGTVKEVERHKPDTPSGLNYIVSLSVDVRVHGGFQEKTVTFPILVRGENEDRFDEADRRIPKPDGRMLVFLRGFGTVALRNGFERMGLLCSPIRAYIFLDDKETEEAVTSAVNKYIHTFNDGGKRDKDGYYEFLCSLLQSPVKRIRDDAELDLMLFYVKEPSLDLEKTLADDRVRKEIKDYLRYLIRNEKPKE